MVRFLEKEGGVKVGGGRTGIRQKSATQVSGVVRLVRSILLEEFGNL